MMKSENINELAAALAKAQGELPRAIKDSSNPFFKSKYADLSAVWDACQGPLSKNGLSVIQTTGINHDGTMYLTSTLLHTSGQYIAGDYPISPLKGDPQGFGSAVTYARRYALQALVGIAPDDDDAEAAMQRERANGIHKQVTNQEPKAPPAPAAKPKPRVVRPSNDPSEYTIAFGIHQGKRLADLGSEECEKYLSFWLDKEAAGERLGGKALETVNAIRAYLEA